MSNPAHSFGPDRDPVHVAIYDGDLDQMLRALPLRTKPIHRHLLLQTIVGITYAQRRVPTMRAKCREIAFLHLSEIPGLLPHLIRELRVVPRVTTFQHLATLLAEDGEHDRAIEVCRLALAHGLKDGTKSGYAGRIARIQKMRGD